MGDTMIRGKQSSSIADVDPTSGGLRITPRPIDVLGSYSFQAMTGTMAAGLAANSPIFSFRWGNTASKLCLLRRIRVALNSLGTGFTAGVGRLEAFFARGFTGSDTGGGAITLTSNQAKRRTSFATSVVTDARISTTATLSAGTRTLDTLPFVSVQFAVPVTTNFVILPTVDLWLPFMGDGDWPLIFAQDEGLVIQATVPATGTWNGLVGIYWDELSAF
jgi:hypothetical protein